MTPADLARRLFREQCNIGPNSTLEAYGETAAVAAMVPLIEALEGILPGRLCGESWNLPGNETVQISTTFGKLRHARAALTPQPEEVAKEYDDRPEWEMRTGFREEDFA